MGSTLKEKNLLQFFLFCVDPIWEGKQYNFDRFASSKVHEYDILINRISVKMELYFCLELYIN